MTMDGSMLKSTGTYGTMNDQAAQIVDYTARVGARYRVESIQLNGWPGSEPPSIQSIQGQHWNKSKADSISERLLHQLRTLGHASAEVQFKFEPVDGQKIGQLTYDITPNRLNTIGQIHIEGIDGRTEKRLRRLAENKLIADSPFDPEKISQVSHQLANTPAYSAVRFSTVASPESTKVDLRFELIEEDKWDFKPFAAVASEATAYELGGGFRWTRSHLGKRNASIKGSHQLGYRTFPFFRWPPEIILNDYGVSSKHEGEVWTTIVPLRGLSLSARASNELGAEIGYQQLATRFEGGLRWSPRAPLVLFGGLGYGQDLFLRMPLSKPFSMTGLAPTKLATSTEQVYGGLEITGDWVDNRSAPRKGFQWRLDAQVYGVIENIPYTRIHNDMRLLHSSGPWTFIQRVGAGQVWWHSDDLDSLTLRFFLGGGQSVRAWGRRRLEAPGYSGTLVEPRLGGDAMLQTSTELRYALFPEWSVLTFVDSGRVWSSVSSIELNQLLPSAGFGLRAPTPFGMATASVAYQPDWAK